MQDRMPPIPVEKMTEAQRKAAAQFAEIRGSEIFGPYLPLLRSPELMLSAQTMGEYLRYRSALPRALNELAILITARQWTQQFEWSIHHQEAIRAGLRPDIADAIAEGRRPESMSGDEKIVHDFCTELHHNRCVSDQTYARAVARFGEQGTIDMIGVAGYYTLLAMVLNTACTPLPPGTPPPLAPLP
jgi:4-carboxymuconolactone decarboxylase